MARAVRRSNCGHCSRNLLPSLLWTTITSETCTVESDTSAISVEREQSMHARQQREAVIRQAFQTCSLLFRQAGQMLLFTCGRLRLAVDKRGPLDLPPLALARRVN